MKTYVLGHKILLCLLLLFTTLGQAQTVSHEFKNTINDVFAGMDLTKVPHHLLTDYAMEYIDLRSYNGVATDTNYVHKGVLTAGYNTLLMARTQTSVPGLVHPDQFHADWKVERQPYTIAVSGLYFKYSRLRESAYQDNDITISNDKLYDKYVNGVWQNPYESDITFMMTAPILKYNYRNMDVVLPANLWYTNQGTQVQDIAINFNDGNGYQIMTMGQSHYLEYASEGTYDWEYRVTLTDGSQLYCRSKMIVEDQLAPISTGFLKRVSSEPCVAQDSLNTTYVNGFDQIEFQGTTTFDGTANSATIQIDYANGSNGCPGITRPLIVAEGFESGLLGNENPLGDNDIRRFRIEARTPSTALRNEIDDYDIIYINWDQGRDDLRRNAALLQDIIEWVNDVKTTTNQNVVLGQSMGGVIARYTLVKMEQDVTLDHDTSLYISHDAPHQGANIPLGIQYFARHMGDQFVSTPAGDIDLPAANGSITIEDIDGVLNDMGTKQLLANHINPNLSLDNSVFDAWQTQLQNKGYPQLTRNIAISNGSHCAGPHIAETNENGTPISFLDTQDELLYLGGDFSPTGLTDVILQFIDPLRIVDIGATAAAIWFFEDPAYLAALLPGQTTFNWRFKAKTLPIANTTANIYKGRIRITKKIRFLGITVLSYDINVTDKNKNNPSQVDLALDSYSGGSYPVTFDLSEIEDNQMDNWFLQLGLTGRTAESFNFIPTPSALDVGGGDLQLSDWDYKETYNAVMPPSAPRTIPFDNFTTSYNLTNINEAHISFNTRNGDWLALELDANSGNEDYFDCSWTCEQEVQGNDHICDGWNTYSVPAGATGYQWSVVDPLLEDMISFVGGTNGNSVVIEPTPGAAGYIQVQCELVDLKCLGTGGGTVYIMEIYIGPPSLDTVMEIDPALTGHIASGNGTGNCDNIGLRADFEPAMTGITDYEWQTSGGNFSWTAGQSGNPRYVLIEPNCNGTFDYEVRAKNSCGWSRWYSRSVSSSGCDHPCLTGGTSNTNTGSHFTLSPVPMDDTLNVSINSLPSGALMNWGMTFRIEIYNMSGLRVKNVNAVSTPAYIDVSNLAPGNYSVVCFYNQIQEGFQVVK